MKGSLENKPFLGYHWNDINGCELGRNWNIQHIREVYQNLKKELSVGIRESAFNGKEKLEIRVYFDYSGTKEFKRRFFLTWETWKRHNCSFRKHHLKGVPEHHQDCKMVPLSYLDDQDWIVRRKIDEDVFREIRPKSLPPIGGRHNVNQLRVFEVGGE